jgi:YfiH family protein
MLQRQASSDGVIYYTSPLLSAIAVPHAFSTRIGGVSPPPLDSLNLGNPTGCAVLDNTDRIQQNYQLLQSAILPTLRDRCFVHQIHGGIVANADSPTFENGQQADALLTTDSKKILAIRTADCVPILLSDASGKTVAAVHAGWRGVIANIIPNTISQMRSDPQNLLAAIGPCISFDAFEVGPEVLNHFTTAFGNAAPIRRKSNGKGHVDLRQACHLQLLQAGIPDSQIDQTDRCTFRDTDEFFSHRRDNGITGRMAALIGPRIF